MKAKLFVVFENNLFKASISAFTTIKITKRRLPSSLCGKKQHVKLKKYMRKDILKNITECFVLLSYRGLME